MYFYQGGITYGDFDSMTYVDMLRFQELANKISNDIKRETSKKR